MNTFARHNRRGFSLVELLAVVLVLAVLAAVAVPLYTNTRRTAAARTCKANIAAIAAAASAYALRNQGYPTSVNNLIGAAEGLAEQPVCPLTGTSTYQLSVAGSGNLTIRCTNDTQHATVLGRAQDYSKTLRAPARDSLL
ncbi:MAG: prepilin-type N-terminal cleavage/methylation domain-containing protein [Chloroherpetonaceae bacterium]|nr:prepilin-type N-terminal cleavage/methylation domain-containing protein [Chthonomonadaceae bacterium]MDW8206799.1 prepilin-type N-terminal cleavage/methylation domain-containing protein [Chloroherpetonaceae bacterium]